MKWSVQNASKGVSEPFSPLSILHLVIGRAFHCVLLSFLPGTKHVFCYWLVFLSVACIESVKCGSSRKTSERNKYLTILLSIVIDTQGGHSPHCLVVTTIFDLIVITSEKIYFDSWSLLPDWRSGECRQEYLCPSGQPADPGLCPALRYLHLAYLLSISTVGRAIMNSNNVQTHTDTCWGEVTLLSVTSQSPSEWELTVGRSIVLRLLKETRKSLLMLGLYFERQAIEVWRICYIIALLDQTVYLKHFLEKVCKPSRQDLAVPLCSQKT